MFWRGQLQTQIPPDFQRDVQECAFSYNTGDSRMNNIDSLRFFHQFSILSVSWKLKYTFLRLKYYYIKAFMIFLESPEWSFFRFSCSKKAVQLVFTVQHQINLVSNDLSNGTHLSRNVELIEWVVQTEPARTKFTDLYIII